MDQKFWNAHVLLKLLCPLILGIGISGVFTIKQEHIYSLLFLSVLICFLSSIFSFPSSKRGIPSILISVAFVLFGFANFQIYKSSLVNFDSNYKAQKHPAAIEIIDKPIEKERSLVMEGIIKKHPDKSLIQQKVKLYFSRTRQETISKGDYLFVNQFINEIQGPKNPHEFNYKKYMHKQGILYQAYINEDNLIEVDKIDSKNKNLIENIRSGGFRFIEKHVSTSNQAVAKALLFGNRDDLSKDRQNEFVKAGTMHILAVSGLHVGILFLLVHFLLKTISHRIKFPNWLSVIILLMIIWLFVLLTGAKASVSRAGIMFSLLAIGLYFFPKSYSLNTLAFAAITLLALHPEYLFDVGFQLSFSAVAGILVIVPVLQSSFPTPKYKLLKYFLDITFVSIAAQIATLPYTIYYFQQFPTMGLIANLAAIPLAFGIVAVGFLGFIFSFLLVIPRLLGVILDFLLSILNQVNHAIADLPFSIISNLYLSKLDFFLLLLSVFCVLLLCKSRQKKFLFFSLFSLVFLSASIAFSKWQTMNKEQFLVYSINDNVIAQYQKGREVIIFAKNQISDESFSYSILPNLKANYIRKRNFYSLNDAVNEQIVLKDGFLFFNNKIAYFLPNENGERTPAVDLLLSDRVDYKELYHLKNIAEKQKVILANTYPNRSVTDTIQNLHFLKTENYYFMNTSPRQH